MNSEHVLAKSYQIILKQAGSLIILSGYTMLVPVVVCIIYAEWYSMAGFMVSALTVVGVGQLIYRTFIHADDPHFNHALIIAALGWLSIAIAGGLPYYVIANITPVDVMARFIPEGATYTVSSIVYFRNPLHCFFESMSALTTTGLSMAVHEPSVGKGILFYRSWSNWLGGAGFIVMVLAVFRNASGKGANLLYSAESTNKKLKPRVIETARSIWKVYFLVTAFTCIYLIIGTLFILPDYPLTENIFDAVNHAMSGLSTGGFSTLDDSIATYGSPKMEILYLFPMIIGSFSIPFLYKVVFEGKISEFRHDIQTRSLIILFIAGSAIQALLLVYGNLVTDPVRTGIFQFISALSTTGWQTCDISKWNWISVIYISGVAMFIGGASGGTVGGIKMIRALLITRVLRWQITKTFLSDSTLKSFRFNGRKLLDAEINEEFTKAASFAVMFFLLVMASTVAGYYITGNVFTFQDAYFESASAQGTVGLSVGITQPSMSPGLELIYIFQMWTGRLEIIPVFALFRAMLHGTTAHA